MRKYKLCSICGAINPDWATECVICGARLKGREIENVQVCGLRKFFEL